MLLRSSQADELALGLVDALDAELAEGADGLNAAVAERLAATEERTRALAALELHARLRDGDGQRHVVATLDDLRRLVERVERADELVAGSREALRDRLSGGTDLTVHPDTIRKAAADLARARSDEVTAAVAVAELEAAGPPVSDSPPDRTTTHDEPRDEQQGLSRRSVVVAVVAAVLAAVAVALTGSPLPLVLPAAAAAWAVTEWVRSREDAADRDVARDNLAAVSALTDRAYGGVALSEPEELLEARRRSSTAQERLRYAEGVWHGLVGPGVGIESLDEVLAARDPQRLGDAELSQTPTLRAAEAHRRRLIAQWKLAWWALDLPVPPIRHADDALRELADQGIDHVIVETWASRSAERSADVARYEELAGGRTVDDLRAVATAPLVPLVVLDERGDIGAAYLSARTAALPPDAPVVVVVAERGGDHPVEAGS